jgi:putative flavoprotein involved in K+ transport
MSPGQTMIELNRQAGCEMKEQIQTEKIETVVIGGGQAGLSIGYYLARRGRPFVILDANERIGDAWRNRWDSLRLFTPARYDGLAGMPFPAPGHSFPTKDQMADYLELYATRFDLPVRNAVKVDRVFRQGPRYIITAGPRRIEAQHVIVAMSGYQVPRVPRFAQELDPAIVQLHSKDYCNPQQLKEGDVLMVGAGNSGAEIGLEVARTHRTWMSGRDTGHVPFRIDGLAARWVLQRIVFRLVFHRLLTIKTPMGRKLRPKVLSQGGPLIRVTPRDLAAAGIHRVPRVVGVRGGLPLLADNRVLDVANVIWCTGFHPGFSWIDLPVFGEDGTPKHEGGVVAGEPGLYFIGLPFLYAFSSMMIHGLSRDAERIVGVIESRMRPAAAQSGTAAGVEYSAASAR